MTRSDARDLLDTASAIGLQPQATPFSLDHANEALLAIENDSIDGAAVILLDRWE
jgi:propanol-preferring alcohol dehydrogenase